MYDLNYHQMFNLSAGEITAPDVALKGGALTQPARHFLFTVTYVQTQVVLSQSSHFSSVLKIVVIPCFRTVFINVAAMTMVKFIVHASFAVTTIAKKIGH